MSQDHIVKLRSSQSSHIYLTRRKAKKDGKQKKLELKKYDPIVQKHVSYKEVKK
jgi:ribosomal protein L33